MRLGIGYTQMPRNFQKGYHHLYICNGSVKWYLLIMCLVNAIDILHISAGSVVKSLPANPGDARDTGWIPGS